MGEAFRIAKLEMENDNARITALREKFWNGIKDMEEVYLNGDESLRAAGFLNVSFNYVEEGESLIMALKDIAVSSGSACISKLRTFICSPRLRIKRRVSPQLNKVCYWQIYHRRRSKLYN